MAFASYTYAGPAGKDRGGTRNRTGPTLWAVLHTSQGGEGPVSAENLASFIRSPATRNPVTGKIINQASYTLVTDTDRVLRIMDDALRCHGAAGANDKGLHICIPGLASQSRAQWLDTVSAAYIEQAARATADWCVKYGIPTHRVFAKDLQAGRKGICDHHAVTLAFGQTDHTDVGPNFPWDVFISRVQELVTPAPEPPPEPPPAPPIAGGPTMFIATYLGIYHYAVFCDKDRTVTKRAATLAELNLVTMGGLHHMTWQNSTLTESAYNAWLESVFEF